MIGLMLISLVLLAGCDLTTDREADTAAAVPGTIALDPLAGEVDTLVNVIGQGWPADHEILISLTMGGIDYAVGRATVDEQGQFRASFIVPENPAFKTQRIIPVRARIEGSKATTEAYFNVTGPTPGEPPIAQAAEVTPSATPTSLPAPTATPTPTAVPTATSSPAPTRTPTPEPPTAVVSTGALNVRAGPDTVYPIIGQVTANQTLEVIGRSEDWWQILYPSADSDVGWVSGRFVIASNAAEAPIVPPPPSPIPTPTATLTATPVRVTQCKPGEWTGCGGRPPALSCPTEYVSPCGTDGNWGECTWDPGTCGGGDYDYLYDNDDDDSNDDDGDDDDGSDDDDDSDGDDDDDSDDDDDDDD
ncbi:MAG TPA: SH3 domain-containing protein [Anaerolineae bacterium]